MKMFKIFLTALMIIGIYCAFEVKSLSLGILCCIMLVIIYLSGKFGVRDKK